MPDTLRCHPSPSIPAEEFLPLRSRIVPDLLPEVVSICRRDSINAPSELISILNQHPEGSCAVEELCCNEFAAALLENVCIGLSATCDLS